jgi:hypothetical protein
MATHLTLEGLKAAKAGHSQAEIIALLQSLGYEFSRNTRHGARMVHPQLAKHPDLKIRRDHSWILVPVGRSLPTYVADDVLVAAALLKSIQTEEMPG